MKTALILFAVLHTAVAYAASPAVEAQVQKVKAEQLTLKKLRATERLGKAHDRVVKATEAEKKIQDTLATK